MSKPVLGRSSSWHLALLHRHHHGAVPTSPSCHVATTHRGRPPCTTLTSASVQTSPLPYMAAHNLPKLWERGAASLHSHRALSSERYTVGSRLTSTTGINRPATTATAVDLGGHRYAQRHAKLHGQQPVAQAFGSDGRGSNPGGGADGQSGCGDHRKPSWNRSQILAQFMLSAPMIWLPACRRSRHGRPG